MITLLPVFLAATGAAFAAQAEKKKDDPKVDQHKVDQAIARALDYLVKTGVSPPHGKWGIENSHELLLLTFHHAGMSSSAPYFQKLFNEMMAGELKRTYNVALQAMVLSELDRVAYQGVPPPGRAAARREHRPPPEHAPVSGPPKFFLPAARGPHPVALY